MIKLGIIGMSKGNGHPYSWSAIFNGYNKKLMINCPFPVIPQYLSKQTFPKDSIKNAKVTHIWTQNKKLSEHIAKSSNIENIVNKKKDLIGKVDAILLARD
ncbi:MAG: oxidoreductase, partial [bacterium]